MDFFKGLVDKVDGAIDGVQAKIADKLVSKLQPQVHGVIDTR